MATKLKRLQLNEVSLVDRGANQHAHITLFKRDDAPANKFEEATAALAKSVSEIVSGDPADVPGALEATFKQYNEHVGEIAKDMYDVSRFADMLSSAAYLARSSQMEADAEGDGSQVPAKLRNWVQQGAQVFQQMASEEVNELIAMANDISKRGGSTAPHEESNMTEIEKKLADAEAALAKANKDLAFAKMSDTHKSFAAEHKLEGEALDAFVAKSAEDRDAHVKANTVEKSVDPEIAKRDAENADLKKRLAAVEETNAKIEFGKKATDLGLAEADGEALRKAYAGEKDGVDRLVALVKGMTEQVKSGKLFEEFGTKKGDTVSTAKVRVDAVVAEMQAIDKSLTRGKAIEKIATDPSHAKLWAEYKAE